MFNNLRVTFLIPIFFLILLTRPVEANDALSIRTLREVGIVDSADLKITLYRIKGKTSSELRNQINAKGPKDNSGYSMDAYLMWQVFWRWPFFDRKPDFSKTLVTYKITVHFPSWEDLPNADPALQDEYTRYIKAMAGHEKGHLDIILRNYKKIQNAVVREASKLGPAMNSDIANAVAKAELAKLWELDRTYDKETKHGQKQGVLFPNSAHR